MQHFLRKIDASGLFLEDCFWDDGAYPATPGVPLMTTGTPAVPAVPAILAQAAVAGVQMFVGGQPATDAQGNPVWVTPPKAAVLAVAEIPAIAEVLPVQQTDQGNLLWVTPPVPAFAGNPIPTDLIATAVPGGFHRPKWSGTAWVEGGSALAPTVPACLLQIDNDTDAIYGAVLGNRAEEYTLAATEAQAYKTAGYMGTVPGSVQSWATAKSWTATQATDDIVLTAARWTAAQAAIRAERLLRKEQARTATNAAGITAAMTAWAGFVAYMRGQLAI